MPSQGGKQHQKHWFTSEGLFLLVFFYLKPSDDEQGWDVELREGLYHAVQEFVWKCPEKIGAALIRKHLKVVLPGD